MPFLPENGRMDGLGSADTLEFARFRFDRRGRCLFRLDQAGNAVLVPLGRTALDVLEMLVERRGAVVEREEIMETVWRGKVVEEANLNVQISNLRDSLGHSRIQTVSGRGYRFVAPVRQPAANAHSTIPTISQGGARPRLSIVVLPFANLSEDREQQYLADGITEDVTADLSRIADMFVISRNTAFTYRNKPVDTKQIGRDLCVRYVLEGSVRRSGNQVRVNAQLIDTATDAHLWAERFDGDIGDLFALQDEITGRIANALNLALIGAEADRPTEHPDALDYIFRGRAAARKPPSRDKYAESISLFERALALDPRSVEAQSFLAIALSARVLDNLTDSPAADIARAEGLARQALAASPRSPPAHLARGQVLCAQCRYEEAIPEYETVIASNRSWASALVALGQCKLYTGSIEETIPLVEEAIRLSPRDPHLGGWYFQIGLVHLLQSRTDEAILWLERARSANPESPFVHASPLPIASKARPNAQPPNSPKPKG
jgi:TolB-like protein